MSINALDNIVHIPLCSAIFDVSTEAIDTAHTVGYIMSTRRHFCKGEGQAQNRPPPPIRRKKPPT